MKFNFDPHPPNPSFIIGVIDEIMYQIDPPPTFNTNFIKFAVFFLKSSLSEMQKVLDISKQTLSQVLALRVRDSLREHSR